jgi:hypothetical protein
MGKSGPQCSVCASSARHQVDIGLAHKIASRVLAQRFGLSRDAIQRHAQNHLSPATKAAILTARKPSEIDLEALRVSESEGLLCQLVASRARLQQLAELSLELGDIKGAVAVEGAVTSNLALVGRLLGQLVTQHNVTTTSILISADYLALRAAIVAALRPYPEAARAVGRALHALESEAAEDIARRAQEPRKAPVAPLLIEGTAAPVATPMPEPSPADAPHAPLGPPPC